MKSNYVIVSTFIMLLTTFSYTKAQSEENILDDKILIVVHIQDGYANGELSKELTEDELEKINQLIEIANPHHVAYSKAMSKILNLTFKKIYVDKSINEFDDRLKLVNENIFIDEGDIFASEELIKYLNQKEISKIVIVGRVAEGCIKRSALSGKKLGYDIYVIPNAIISESQKTKTKVMKRLKDKGIKELEIN